MGMPKKAIESFQFNCFSEFPMPINAFIIAFTETLDKLNFSRFFPAQ